MPGHYIKVNNHDIFGYSRYTNMYHEMVNIAEDGALFVELGSFLGQSTAAMAAMIKHSNKQIRFDAVDIFELSEFSDDVHHDIVKEHGGNFLQAFTNNLLKADVLDIVNIVKATSLQAASRYPDRSISYLMIDASHKYQDVCDDIRAWYPKIKMGGIISGDDYDWEEVNKAVVDTIPKHSVYDGSTWFLKKEQLTL
jgi:predicted O-methyltransferase YrrM